MHRYLLQQSITVVLKLKVSALNVSLYFLVNLEALANSSVKIRGRDVLATWKVLVTLVLVPLTYFIYALLIYVYIGGILNLPTIYKIGISLQAFILMPAISYISLIFGERGMDIYRSLNPLALQLFPGGGDRARSLRELRTALSDEITNLINELGPKLFPDWGTRLFRSKSEGAQDDNSGPSGAVTPSLISLRGWIKSPIELLNAQSFDWEQTDQKDEDGVFFFEDNQPGGAIIGRSRKTSFGDDEPPPFGFVGRRPPFTPKKRGASLSPDDIILRKDL